MRFLRVVIFSRVSRSPEGARAGAGAGAAGAGAGAAFAACSITSGLLTTPPRPVPATSEMEMPASSATRRAAGDDFGSDAVVAGGAAGVDGAAAGVAGAGVGADGAGDGALAGAAVSSSSPRSWSTFTTSPSLAEMDVITPARGAGTSTVILSVSSSTIVSPLLTASPFFLSQRDTVASTIDSPSGGTLMDIITLEA